MQLLFGWECSPTWYKIAHVIELFIMDAFVDLFITLCIIANTVFMAMEHYDMGKPMETLLTNGNYVRPNTLIESQNFYSALFMMMHFAGSLVFHVCHLLAVFLQNRRFV